MVLSAAKFSHPGGSHFMHQIARYHWHERVHVCAREGEGQNTGSLAACFPSIVSASCLINALSFSLSVSLSLSHDQSPVLSRMRAGITSVLGTPKHCMSSE